MQKKSTKGETIKKLDNDCIRYKILSEILIKIDKNLRLQKHHEYILNDKDYNGEILDVGGHFGQFAIVSKLCDESRDITSIDGSPLASVIATTLAKKAGASINIHIGLIENNYFNDEQYDVVVLSNVIEHFEETNFLLNWIYRITKKGGVIYITMPYKNFHWDPHHTHFYSLDDSEGFTNITEVLKKKRWSIEVLELINDKQDIMIKVRK